MNRISAENLTVRYPLMDRVKDKSIATEYDEKQVSWGKILLGDKPSILALDRITLSVNSGQRLALIGKNGSGKTTLLRTLGRIITPNSGRLSMNGTVSGIFSLKQGLKPESSGRRNILIRGILLGMSREEIKAKQDQIEKFSELGDYLDLPISTYSSGMLIRLVFSVVVAFRPDIMLLDEWIGTADESFQSRVEKWLHEYSNSGGTFIIASHSRSLVSKMCESGILMKNGRIIYSGSTDDVLKKYSNI